MRDIVFEVCAETLEACVAAAAGGADRVELCSALSEGGLTPSHGLIQHAVERCALPVHVMIRPRAGDFVYSAEEIAIMRADIAHARRLGVAGVVLGVLDAAGCVDVAATRGLVELARPLQVTFHRAVDDTVDLHEALEDVIAAGCDRVLTSGGAADVMAGAAMLAELVRAARGRIEVAVGGGLRLDDAARLAQITGARQFHASLRQTSSGVQPAAVRAMVEQLRAEPKP
jgi:copper homeostasis protein